MTSTDTGRHLQIVTDDRQVARLMRYVWAVEAITTCGSIGSIAARMTRSRELAAARQACMDAGDIPARPSGAPTPHPAVGCAARAASSDGGTPT